MAIVTGTYKLTGTTFISTHEYFVNEHLELGHFQSIDVDEMSPIEEWSGWDNFDHNCSMYVFGYGSLSSGPSIERTLGRSLRPSESPVEATIYGWRRGWYVGSDSATHPEFQLVDESGQPYNGVVAYLGLTQHSGEICNGTVFPVGSDELSILDERERNYNRIDVTNDVSWSTKPGRCVVFTYVQTEEAAERLRSAADAGVACVRKGYIALVEERFQEIGDAALRAFRDSTDDAPLPIRDLTFVDP